MVTDEPYIHDFFAADTFISLKVYGGADPASLCEKVEAKTAELEQVLSCHLQSSELSKINSSPSGEYELSDELAEVISTSLDMADLTRGAYDPTVAPAVRSFGTSGEAMRRYRPSPKSTRQGQRQTIRISSCAAIYS